MAALIVSPMVLGNICVLDKTCRKHKTNEGEFAVVTRYNPATEDDVENLTLLIFAMDEKDAALSASGWLKAHPDTLLASEADVKRFAAIVDHSSTELTNLSGPMLRGIHSNYVADLLKRKTRDSVRFTEDQREEIVLASQLVGESFKATLALEDEGEQFIETHIVRIDAVEEHPEKVCFVFMRNGLERSMIMRANQAIKHLPSKVHLMEVHFLSPQALAILKLLPSSADAEDHVICCEEVNDLMDQLGFATDKTNQGFMSDDAYEVHMKRVGGQAAVQFDNALSAHEASGQSPLKLPEANVTVDELVAVLLPIRCLVPSDLARSKGVRPPPPGILASASEYPRAQAVKDGAQDLQAFQELLTTILPWFTEPNRLEATMRHEATGMRALNIWLEAAGLRAEPMVIAAELGYKSSSAAELTVWALGVDDFEKAKRAAEVVPPHRVNNQASLAAMNQVISHRIIQPDTTGTEGERRERNALANHANELVNNPVLEGLLKELSDLATKGDIAKLFDTLNTPSLRDSPLYPLLNTGEELSKAVAGNVSGETLLRLNTVRGALERRIEMAFTAHGEQLTQQVKTALRAMRMGKMSKAKFFNLLADVSDDKGTPDSPLQFLVDLKDEKMSDAFYVRALQAVGYVWVLCTPYDAANIQTFMIALTNFTTKQRANGASWQALSKFHAVLLRKIDEESEKYVLNESKIFRASPRTSWIDAPSRHLQDLTASVAVSAAKQVAAEAMKEMQLKLDAMKKVTTPSTSDKSKKLKEQFDKSKKESSDLRKKLEALKKDKGSTSTAGGAQTEKRETGEGKRKREARAMLEKFGADDKGQPPCFFHHREGAFKCRFDSDTCKSGHHLGKADDA